jgi:hypothetical protein
MTDRIPNNDSATWSRKEREGQAGNIPASCSANLGLKPQTVDRLSD